MDYPDFIARFYDVIYAKVRTVDHDYFLRKILESKGSVLEIGVGTGRFFLEALNKGADIYGVDLSEAMLRQLKMKLDRSQHHRILLQDARSLKLERRFGLIVAPFRVLSHLLEVDDQLQLLNAVHEHLNPGGRFIFDVYVPDLKILQQGIVEQTDFEGEYAPGRKLKRVVSAKPDLIRQISDITMTLTWDEAEGVKTGTWHAPLRFFFRYELEQLVGRSNLHLKHVYGDYDEHELESNSKDFIVVCERSA